MALLKKNTTQPGRPPKAGKRSKQDRRWTLLFIGNHGRTITLKRFKGIVLISVIVLAVSMAASVGLFVWNQKIIMANHDLKDELKNLNKRIDALRHDNDILMTRLVLAESRVQESLGTQTQTPASEKIPDQEQPAPPIENKANPVAAKTMEPPAPRQVEPRQSGVPADAGLSVAVESFNVLNHTDDQRLKVIFKIKNTSPNSQKVSGHVFVVLKGEQTKWLPIPWTPLVDGRPTGKQRGHSFGINYFKTMRLSTRSPKFPEKFETASLYVFTRQGELLLEKGYPVKLSPNKPQAAKPLPGVQAIPAETAKPLPGVQAIPAETAKPLPGLHAIPTETAAPPEQPTPASKTSPPSGDALLETLKDTPAQ